MAQQIVFLNISNRRQHGNGQLIGSLEGCEDATSDMSHRWLPDRAVPSAASLHRTLCDARKLQCSPLVTRHERRLKWKKRSPLFG